jgi:hypothetical protein
MTDDPDDEQMWNRLFDQLAAIEALTAEADE